MLDAQEQLTTKDGEVEDLVTGLTSQIEALFPSKSKKRPRQEDEEQEQEQVLEQQPTAKKAKAAARPEAVAQEENASESGPEGFENGPPLADEGSDDLNGKTKNSKLPDIYDYSADRKAVWASITSLKLSAHEKVELKKFRKLALQASMRKQKSTSYVNGQVQKLLYAPECLYKLKDGVLPGTSNNAGTGGTPLSPEAYKAFRKAYSVEHRKQIELRAFTKFQETQLNKLLQEHGYGDVVAARGAGQVASTPSRNWLF
ncbi:hypothetical protein JKP88DRAFT_349080 [Tribonema minus]|uniref:Uncharacterized protein n=1 Tax=Tribonema minus TaxID=303371 RepID=A0A835YV62_9STRA|nr:hypothetical protein JKP88DRAFT_349080 [Tribonema minus]